MTTATKPIGVLLLQLGTPDSTEVDDVRSYLREFLSDPRVLDVPAPVRSFLLNAIILPFRPRRSAEAYEKIWTDEGSPLTIHTEALRDKVQERLGEGYLVEFGMRYKNPSIESALKTLTAAGAERLVVLPLFPQYASASGGSAVAKTYEIAAEQWNVPDLTAIGAFYDDPGFVRAVSAIARPMLEEFEPDHVIFSYHGLPEKQVRKSDTTGEWCLQVDDCCATINEAN
ncbi:MAG: ferrochelatase, partial [Halobacteriales archaeon]|nr:ferrochelatase [Halobacteriales archaeon]